MLKIYLSSSSDIPKCLTCIVTIAMLDKLKLPSMKSEANTMADALHSHCAGASALEGGRWGIPHEGLQGAIQLGGVGHFGDSHVPYVR